MTVADGNATDVTGSRDRSVVRPGEATINVAAEASARTLSPSATRRVVLRRLGARAVGLAVVGIAP